jgi:hypothetical protein
MKDVKYPYAVWVDDSLLVQMNNDNYHMPDEYQKTSNFYWYWNWLDY